MAQAAFDTIAEVQRLRDSGLEQAQAEAITRAIHAGVTGGVATKADLDLVRTELQGEIQTVKTELQGEIQLVRTELHGEIQLVRQEVQTVKTELQGEIQTVKTELVEDIGNVRTDVQKIHTLIATGQANQLRWMIGLAIAILGVLVATLTLG